MLNINTCSRSSAPIIRKNFAKTLASAYSDLMKSVFSIVAILLIAFLAYLFLWPVPINPMPWDAPINRGYVDDYASNEDLAGLTRIDLSPHHGPEDIVALDNGRLLTATQEGFILTVDPVSGSVDIMAETGGVPLGMEYRASTNSLIVADAHKGLLEIGLDGSVEVLTDDVDGTPILYADDLDIGEDGIIYFSDASTKFGAKANGTTMEASLLEIMEGDGTGRLLAFDPSTDTTRVILDGLVFPNGVAVSADGDILMTVTGRYQVLKINPKTGESDVLIDNLPGFPDNINRGPDDTFFVGLVSPRSDWLDDNADNPFMRRLAMRLPAFMRPQAQAYGLILQINAGGDILRTWHDPDGQYLTPTGAVVVPTPDGDRMYITSLLSPDLGYRSYP